MFSYVFLGDKKNPMGITFLRGQTVGGENNNVEKITNPDEINIDDDDDDDEESDNEVEEGKSVRLLSSSLCDLINI